MSVYESKNHNPSTAVFAVFPDLSEADKQPKRGRWLARAAMTLGMAAVGIAVYGLSKAGGQLPEMAGWNFEAMDQGMQTASDYGVAVLGAVAGSMVCGVGALYRKHERQPKHALEDNDISTYDVLLAANTINQSAGPALYGKPAA